MKPSPEHLWKSLLHAAAPPAVPEATEEEVSRIVARLRWQPASIILPSWEDALWPLLLRFALPGAALILIFASLLPTPEAPVKGDSVDDLIAALLPPP